MKTMKKLDGRRPMLRPAKKYIWMLGLALCAVLGFSSCEPDLDENVGYDVRGHWFGDMDMWIDNEKARGSEIEFTPSGWGYSYGRGIEVDYYRYGSVTHYFDYRIRNGVIYITFDDPYLDCAIVDYRLSYSYFTGYIADYYTLENQSYFSLRNYDRYWDQYGYGSYYYAKGQTLETNSLGTRATDDEHQPLCIRGVNRAKNNN